MRQSRYRYDRRQSRHSGPGLRFKLALFTIALVLLVIVMVSAPLYYMMIREQEKTLLRGLWDRSTVLLDGLATNAAACLPLQNRAELSLLPAHSAAVPEARYVTISDYEDRVWATNDPDILSKIDTPQLQPGVSVLSDALSPRLEIIKETPPQPGSEPEYVFNYIPGNHRFLFFKPIMALNDAGGGSFIGMARLEVSIDAIARDIQSEQALLLRTILLISFVVLAMGVVVALLLSSLVIRPIGKLARHVELIRDTDNQKSLAGMEIHVGSRDEIAMLGDTINDMTQRLARAAVAASELSIGREIQKKFLPLELDKNGNKLSTGCKDTENAVFFGYYEGAGEVSGDYFDYQDIDGRYYAVIKCDVAGKGIPAALIMIQVATMFLNYFKQWSPRGMRITEVVYQINGFIETLGFQGRFAAFTLCVFDSQTGELHFCNAGDNIIHIFDASERRVKTVTLPQSPAAGALSNDTVASKGGYQAQTLTLDHGDMLLLYTDGIEDAKRKFRDSECGEMVCAGGEEGTAHGNHAAGQGSEQMGSRRVHDIINAVMNRDTYSLHKWHSGDGDEDLLFNFSGCGGSLEELIMALIAAEKMFRCYYDPKAARDEWALADKKIDAFLKDRFLQYHTYCAHTRECPGNGAYMYYTHLREDAQYDDLAILGIKRK